jgi:hypothetical protein
VVFLLLLFREQTLALSALLLLGLGTALTGFFPSVVGLYLTTLLMSLGFHYYETMQTSLAQQWLAKERAAETFGQLIALGSAAAIVAFGLLWLNSHALVFYLCAAMALVSLLLASLIPRQPAPGCETRWSTDSARL